MQHIMYRIMMVSAVLMVHVGAMDPDELPTHTVFAPPRLAEVSDPAAREVLELAVAEVQRLSAAVVSLQAMLHERGKDDGENARRRAQDSSNNATFVEMLTVKVTSQCPDNTHVRRRECAKRFHTSHGADGIWKAADCDEPTGWVRCCHADLCEPPQHAGHRRAQSGTSHCSPAELVQYTEAVNRACCDEQNEDCTGGHPHTCNTDCAEIFLPFWADCRSALGSTAALFEDAVAMCTPPPSLAQQLNIQCVDSLDSCIPDCTGATHGVILLLNLDGDDTKLSCEIQNGAFAWVAPAITGGFLGGDPLSFIGATNSEAPGPILLAMVDDVVTDAAVAVVAGQYARIGTHLSIDGLLEWTFMGESEPAFRVTAEGRLFVKLLRMLSPRSSFPTVAVEQGAEAEIAECEFFDVGGAVVVSVRGDGAVATLTNTKFQRLCRVCHAVEAMHGGAAYFKGLDVRPAALSEALSFPLCIDEADDSTITYSSTCSATAVRLIVTESSFVSPLGTLTVPVNQTLDMQALPPPIRFNGRFDVHGSLSATGLVIPTASTASSSDDREQAMFTGSGSLSLDDCWAVDDAGQMTALGAACTSLSVSHGQLSGNCNGLLHDRCLLQACNEGYVMSGADGDAKATTVVCEAGGTWNKGLPSCSARPCATSVISNSDRLDDNRCAGVTGDHCDFVCDPGFQHHGAHICQTDGRFSGGSCRPAELCFDDPTWTDAAGETCSTYAELSAVRSCEGGRGPDGRMAAEACEVSCSSCKCAAPVDTTPGPGGVSCSVIAANGYCHEDATVLGVKEMSGVPLWTLCCDSCRGCDGIVNSGAVLDDCNVCGGDGTSCMGCDGVIQSGMVVDDCGICGGDGNTCRPCEGGTPLGLRLWNESPVGDSYDACLSADTVAPLGDLFVDGYQALELAHGDVMISCSRASPCRWMDPLVFTGDFLTLHNLVFDRFWSNITHNWDHARALGAITAVTISKHSGLAVSNCVFRNQWSGIMPDSTQRTGFTVPVGIYNSHFSDFRIAVGWLGGVMQVEGSTFARGGYAIQQLCTDRYPDSDCLHQGGWGAGSGTLTVRHSQFIGTKGIYFGAQENRGSSATPSQRRVVIMVSDSAFRDNSGVAITLADTFQPEDNKGFPLPPAEAEPLATRLQLSNVSFGATGLHSDHSFAAATAVHYAGHDDYNATAASRWSCPHGVDLDACNVCGGSGTTCLGCDGIPFSGAEINACGGCGLEVSCGCDGVYGSGMVTQCDGTCGTSDAEGGFTGCFYANPNFGGDPLFVGAELTATIRECEDGYEGGDGDECVFFRRIFRRGAVPELGGRSSNWSIKWRGIIAFAAGQYTFTDGTDYDVGLSTLSIDGRWIVNLFGHTRSTSAPIYLSDGPHTVLLTLVQWEGPHDGPYDAFTITWTRDR